MLRGSDKCPEAVVHDFVHRLPVNELLLLQLVYGRRVLWIRPPVQCKLIEHQSFATGQAGPQHAVIRVCSINDHVHHLLARWQRRLLKSLKKFHPDFLQHRRVSALLANPLCELCQRRTLLEELVRGLRKLVFNQIGEFYAREFVECTRPAFQKNIGLCDVLPVA